jgi:hypothetical protein
MRSTLSQEFQFVEFGWGIHFAAFLRRGHRIQSAIAGLQRRLAAEQDAQLEGLRGAIGEVGRDIKGVAVRLSQTEEAVERSKRIRSLGSNPMSEVCGQRLQTAAHHSQRGFPAAETCVSENLAAATGKPRST